MCALSQTKLKGKGEGGRRHGEGRGGSVSELVVDEVCSQMEDGVIHSYVG